MIGIPVPGLMSVTGEYRWENRARTNPEFPASLFALRHQAMPSWPHRRLFSARPSNESKQVFDKAENVSDAFVERVSHVMPIWLIHNPFAVDAMTPISTLRVDRSALSGAIFRQ
jgi:hypothetical protein